MLTPEQKAVIRHYERLLAENNDPVLDPPALRAYMNQWDGPLFIEKLALSPEKSVLEIGVGTGRLAVQVAPRCRFFCGIDISPKTAERAREHLHACPHAVILCGDFLTCPFQPNTGQPFDIIYSSLTFLHFPDKAAAVRRAASLLAPGGRLVLSLDKNQNRTLACIPVYPDTPEGITACMQSAGLRKIEHDETALAHLLTAQKTHEKSP